MGEGRKEGRAGVEGRRGRGEQMGGAGGGERPGLYMMMILARARARSEREPGSERVESRSTRIREGREATFSPRFPNRTEARTGVRGM